MFTRSTTGCYTCKNRKKKCDETHPKCLRCARAGLECGGYAPLDSPDGKGVMRRSKIGATPSASTKGSQVSSLDRSPNTAVLCGVVHNGSTPAKELATSTTRHPPRSDHGYTGSIMGAQLGNSVVSGYSHPDGFVSTNLFNTEPVVISQPDAMIRPVDSLPFASLSGSMPSVCQPAAPLVEDPSSLDYSYILPYYHSPNDQSSLRLASKPTTPSQSLPVPPNAGVCADITTFSLSSPTNTSPHIVFGPVRSLPKLSADSRNEGCTSTSSENSAALVRTVCKTPTPDPNTQDNALAFVVQSYTRWANFIVFSPGTSKITPLVEGVVSQFSLSPSVRTRIILIANITGALSKAPVLNSKIMSLVTMLQTQVNQALVRFQSTGLTGERDLDIQSATEALEHTTDMTIINYYLQSFSTMTRLLQDVAPVFRRACPEASEQLVNLPNVLLRSKIQLGHFATTDVILSVLTTQPMLFKYDVSQAPEVADQIMENASGLRWLHGFPDHIVILFARINMLYEDFGASIDPQHVLDIEKQVRSVKAEVTTEPKDPFATVWRLTVQECWRQTVYIYLYMMLCQAKADDPRVLKATRTFTRILNGIMPGRTPDSFMTLPMMIAGVSAYKAWDRNVIYQRLSGLRESNTAGSWVNEYLSVLVDIWTRTNVENRPAGWHDIRLSFLKVTSV